MPSHQLLNILQAVCFDQVLITFWILVYEVPMWVMFRAGQPLTTCFKGSAQVRAGMVVCVLRPALEKNLQKVRDRWD